MSLFKCPRVNLNLLLYSPLRKINVHVLGRYFSISFVNCSNENGFLNISLIPLSFICSKTLASDEAVKITMFFCTIWSGNIFYHRVGPGLRLLCWSAFATATTVFTLIMLS